MCVHVWWGAARPGPDTHAAARRWRPQRRRRRPAPQPRSRACEPTPRNSTAVPRAASGASAPRWSASTTSSRPPTSAPRCVRGCPPPNLTSLLHLLLLLLQDCEVSVGLMEVEQAKARAERDRAVTARADLQEEAERYRRQQGACARGSPEPHPAPRNQFLPASAEANEASMRAHVDTFSRTQEMQLQRERELFSKLDAANDKASSLSVRKSPPARARPPVYAHAPCARAGCAGRAAVLGAGAARGAARGAGHGGAPLSLARCLHGGGRRALGPARSGHAARCGGRGTGSHHRHRAAGAQPLYDVG